MSVVKPIFKNEGVYGVIDNSDWDGTNFEIEYANLPKGLYQFNRHRYSKTDSNNFQVFVGGSGQTQVYEIGSGSDTTESIKFYLDGVVSNIIKVRISGGTLNAASTDSTGFSFTKIQ